MRNKKYSIPFGIAFVCAILLTACNNTVESPETQMSIERGYGRITITFAEEKAALQQARTVFPLMEFDRYEYTFTKEGEETGVEKTPDNDGYFTLEVGTYIVEVQAFVGTDESYTLAATGVSPPFDVGPGDNAPVDVPLREVDTAEYGEFSYTITFPEGAEAEITLHKWRWPEQELITLTPNTMAEGNGITETLELEAGSYLLTVLIEKDFLYAGISEAVHIRPLLTTVFTKTFDDEDLLLTQFTVTFDSNGATSGTAPNAQTISAGSGITLPGPGTLAMTGHVFGRWNTEADGTGINYDVGTSFIVIENVTLYAEWDRVYTLTTGVNVEGRGTVSLSPDQPHYAPGTQVTVTAVPNVADFWFDYWIGIGAPEGTAAHNTSITVIMDNDLTLTAVFQPNYILTTGPNVPGRGTVSRSPDQTSYAPGTQVMVTAVPNAADFWFDQWTGTGAPEGQAANNISITFTMGSDLTLTAVFQPNYTLTTDVNVPSRGAISLISPNQTSYAPGTKVTVTATPTYAPTPINENKFRFHNWTGTGVPEGTAVNDNEITVTMTSNLTLTANFQEQRSNYPGVTFNPTTTVNSYSWPSPSNPLPSNVKFPATIEVYALGGGGGGQGGNFWSNNHGTGAAGGGGAVTYIRFEANGLETFGITVGKGGAGGPWAWAATNDLGHYGHPGGDGGDTTVSWFSNTLTVKGGGGGGIGLNDLGERSKGGRGGEANTEDSIPVLDQNREVIWNSISGEGGHDKGSPLGLNASKGGDAGKLINIGSINTFGGGLGARHNPPIPGEADTGAGARGGYGRDSNGGNGGNGQVVIIVTWYE